MSSAATSRLLRALVGISALAILALAGVFLSRVGLAGSSWALVLVTAGNVALLALGFSPQDMGTASSHAAGWRGRSEHLRRSARVWKAAARNAWVLGVLGATTAFVAHFCSGFAKIGSFLVGLADVGLSLAYGLGLVALLSIPALRLSQRQSETDLSEPGPESPEPGAALSWGRLPAYGLLALLATWPLLSSHPDSSFQAADLLLHWPAILVVAGGGLGLAAYLGFPRNGEALTLGLALAGVLAAFLGLSQGLRGIASGSIEAVSAGLNFTISACYASLVGLAVFALPMQDRVQGRRDEAPSLASRVAAYGLPVVVLACLVVTTLLVVTPMEKTVPSHDDPEAHTEAPVGRLEATRPLRLD